MLTIWYTAKCEDVQRQLGSDNGSGRVIDYSDPASEGTNIILECSSPNLVHNTTTCVENGKWEPDPREVKCIGES